MRLRDKVNSMLPEIPHAILLISCPDRKGLVARISDFVFKNYENIVYADEYIDNEVELAKAVRAHLQPRVLVYGNKPAAFD